MDYVNKVAQKGFTLEAGLYQKGRPEYPDELLKWLSDNFELSANNHVLEVGAGTGKFTKLLVRTGARISVAEPVQAMLENLKKALPQVETVQASAQSLPFPDHSIDVIMCAQAFHWFASHETLLEFHRLLKPSGKLILIWNARNESVDWVAEITRIITPYENDSPRFYKGEWRLPFKAQQDGSSKQLFAPLQVNYFPNVHMGPTVEVIVARFMSVSFIAALPDTEKEKVRLKLLHLIDIHPELQGKKQIVLPYRTEVYWTSPIDLLT